MKSNCPFRHMIDNGGSGDAPLHARSLSEPLFKKQSNQASAPVTSRPRVVSDTAIARGDGDGGRQVEICRFNLLGRCAYKDNCMLKHFELPYQWQVKRNGEWMSLDCEANKEVETKFCQPRVYDVLVQIKYVLP